MRRVRFAALGLIAGTAWLYATGLTPVDTFLIVTGAGLLAFVVAVLVDANARTRR